MKVEFATGERIRIKAFEDDGQVQVGVSEKIRCEGVDPTVNTPVDEGSDSGHDDGGDDDGRGDDRGDGN